MHGHGHIVRAKAAATDVFAAVDRVVDKLEHRHGEAQGQADRTVPSPQARIGRIRPDSRHAVTTTSRRRRVRRRWPTAAQPRIVKTKQFAIKPMTPEEAALQMDLLGHDFFFFTNAETGRAAVVYRRDRRGHRPDRRHAERQGQHV